MGKKDLASRTYFMIDYNKPFIVIYDYFDNGDVVIMLYDAAGSLVLTMWYDNGKGKVMFEKRIEILDIDMVVSDDNDPEQVDELLDWLEATLDTAIVIAEHVDDDVDAS